MKIKLHECILNGDCENVGHNMIWASKLATLRAPPVDDYIMLQQMGSTYVLWVYSLDLIDR